MESKKRAIAITLVLVAIAASLLVGLRIVSNKSKENGKGTELDAGTPEIKSEVIRVISHIKTRDGEFNLCEVKTTGSSWNRELVEIYKVDCETSEQIKVCDKDNFKLTQDGKYESIKELAPDKVIEIYEEEYWDPTLKDVTNEYNYLPKGTTVYKLTDRESAKFIRGQIGNGAELLEFMQYSTEEWSVAWELILVNSDRTQLQRMSYRRNNIDENGRLIVYQTDMVGSFLGKLGIIQKSGYQM